jgi:hypothetical protein
MIEIQKRIAGEAEKEGCYREFILTLEDKPADAPEVGYRAGLYCPKCRQAILDYDGMLNLVCPNCGVVQGGCFT